MTFSYFFVGGPERYGQGGDCPVPKDGSDVWVLEGPLCQVELGVLAGREATRQILELRGARGEEAKVEGEHGAELGVGGAIRKGRLHYIF